MIVDDNCLSPADLTLPELQRLYNHERVRSYLEKHPRALRKEVAYALDMRPVTAGRYIQEVTAEIKKWNSHG